MKKLTSICCNCNISIIISENWEEEEEGYAERGGFMCTKCANDPSTNCPDCDEMLCSNCNCPECGDGEW